MSSTQPNDGDDPVPSNAEVATLLREIAQLLKLEGSDRFRQQAYARAADILEQYPMPVAALSSVDEVMTIPGMQEPIAERIMEFGEHGSIGYLDHLRRLFPVEMRRLMRVPGVDTAIAHRCYRELGVTSLRALENALQEGRIGKLLGEEAAGKVRSGLAQVEHPSNRVPLGQILAPIRKIIDCLTGVPGVLRADVSGSARRWEEAIGTLSFTAASANPRPLIEAFVRFPLVDRVFEQASERALVNLAFGLQAELRVSSPDTYGAMLLHTTGSERHLQLLREVARAAGYVLDMNGLVRQSDGVRIPCREEHQLYEALGMQMPAPEMRQGADEIAWALAGGQPRVLDADDIQGDLHVHGAWDDGGGTLADIAKAARESGYRYVAVTNHAVMGSARHDAGHFHGGVDMSRLQRQFGLIDRFNTQNPDVRILKGIEAEIGPGGHLLWSPECAGLADFVIAGTSSREELAGPACTERLLGAIRSGQVDVIAHPTGRLLNQRTPAQLDWDVLLPAALAQRVAWEINAHWRRLDLSDRLARQISPSGALFWLGSDAHHPSQFAGMAFGLAIARRAFLPVDRIVNSWPLERLLSWLRERPRQAA